MTLIELLFYTLPHAIGIAIGILLCQSTGKSYWHLVYLGPFFGALIVLTLASFRRKPEEKDPSHPFDGPDSQ